MLLDQILFGSSSNHQMGRKNTLAMMVTCAFVMTTLALLCLMHAEARPLPEYLDYYAMYKTQEGPLPYTTKIWSLYSQKKMLMVLNDGQGHDIGALLFLDSPKGSTTGYHYFQTLCRKEVVGYTEGEEYGILPLAGRECREKAYFGVSKQKGREVESWEVTCSAGRSILYVKKDTDILVRVDREINGEIVSFDIDQFETKKPDPSVFELPSSCSEEGLKLSEVKEQLRESLKQRGGPARPKGPQPVIDEDEEEDDGAGTGEWQQAENVVIY